MFPEVIVNTPFFGICLTVVVYVFCEALIARLQLKYCPPMLLSALIIILLLMHYPGLSYAKYQAGAQFIALLLGPATIALALPLYRNRGLVKENLGAIASGIIFGTIFSIVFIFFAGKLLGASHNVLVSMLPKSVTTPIAIEVSKSIGGLPALTTAAVVLSGIFGAAFNHKLLKLIGIKDDLVAGLAIGLSSHGLGTSACANVSMVQLAIGGVSMGLTGIATSILAPILLPILEKL